MEPGDIIIDGGNEWYENTERRKVEVEARGLLYMGMGVSGGEEGARRGPSMMPGGSAGAYQYIKVRAWVCGVWVLGVVAFVCVCVLGVRGRLAGGDC